MKGCFYFIVVCIFASAVSSTVGGASGLALSVSPAMYKGYTQQASHPTESKPKKSLRSQNRQQINPFLFWNFYISLLLLPILLAVSWGAALGLFFGTVPLFIVGTIYLTVSKLHPNLGKWPAWLLLGFGVALSISVPSWDWTNFTIWERASYGCGALVAVMLFGTISQAMLRDR